MVVRYTFIGTLSALLVTFLRTLYSTHALMVLSVQRGLQIYFNIFHKHSRGCCWFSLLLPSGVSTQRLLSTRLPRQTSKLATPAFRHFLVVNEYIFSRSFLSHFEIGSGVLAACQAVVQPRAFSSTTLNPSVLRCLISCLNQTMQHHFKVSYSRVPLFKANSHAPRATRHAHHSQ